MVNHMSKIFAALLALLLSVQLSFAQFAEQRVWNGTSGGSANTYTLSVANMPAPVTGIPVRFIPIAPNTTVSTVNLNSSGVKNIYKPSPAGPVALTGGELQASQVAEIVYDGTQYVITSSVDSTATSIFPSPQGYLTPCKVATPVTGCTAGNLVPTSDVTAATILYYEPATGNQLPIYNGTRMVVFSFTEAQMTLTLGSGHLANTIYDVCVFNNSGTPQIVTNVAWTTSTAGSGARGTGAGTAQITRVNGLWVNAVTMTGINGASTYSNIPASQCTMVGSIYIDGTNGQVSFLRAFGISRKWSSYNFYNQLPIALQEGDATATWTYATNTLRPSNNATTNQVVPFISLPDQSPTISISQHVATGANVVVRLGIGWNSTTAISGLVATTQAPAAGGLDQTVTAIYVPTPFIGVGVATSLEAVTGSSTFSGQASGMLLSASWRG